jgi:hypothetical protein
MSRMTRQSFAYCLFAPKHIKAKGKHTISQIVTGRDLIKHLPDCGGTSGPGIHLDEV